MAPTSGPTIRRRARIKGDRQPGAGSARGAWPISRRLRNQGLRDRRRAWPGDRLRARPRTGTRAAHGAGPARLPARCARMDRRGPGLCLRRLARAHLEHGRATRNTTQADTDAPVACPAWIYNHRWSCPGGWCSSVLAMPLASAPTARWRAGGIAVVIGGAGRIGLRHQLDREMVASAGVVENRSR